MQSGHAQGALSHLRVLDMSRVLAGPWAGQLLGDLGADVIKVERPGFGDDTRTLGPPFLRDRLGEPTSEAAYYLCTNRNKRSVTIDITHVQGQKLLRALIARSDVVIENYKVGSLAAYGLDYASLKEDFPRLVYCSITGFGQTGPYASRAGYDYLVQAMGGLMSVTGRADGEEGAGPSKVGVAVTDLLTGLYASNAILAALACRDRTGEGQHIDLALLDVQVACMANQAMNYLYGEGAPRRLGNAHPNIVPYQDFPTADGDVIIAVGNDAQFRRLCAAMERPELAEDSRYAANGARVANRQTLIRSLREITLTRTTDDWVRIFEKVNVPCGPINDMARVFADAQVIARGMKVEVDHPLAGAIPLVANPIRLSATPVSYRSAPPTLGEDTREVLETLAGCDAATIDRLRALNVI